MIRSLRDYVFVEVEGTLFNEDSGRKGINGNIIIDPSYDPQVHVKISGKAIALPEMLSKHTISQETKGMPSYEMARPFKYKRREDIAPEVEIGDIVYFHFNTLLSDNKNWLYSTDTTQVFKVAYENIICSVRDFHADGQDLKEVVMIGGYCLIEPDLESWEETLIPTPQLLDGKPMLDKNGNKVLKPKDQWLIAKLKPEARYLSGYVINMGTPLKGEKPKFKRGDRILYRVDADWKQTIEGTSYFTIRQRHIMAHEVLDKKKVATLATDAST